VNLARRGRWHDPRDVGPRALAWILVTPISGAGVLAAHAAAYWLTRADAGPDHGYLAHAPQVVGLLASLGLLGLAVQERSLHPRSARWFAPVAPVGFACQEHLERALHTGELPWLLTSPTFLLGLALQLPVAAACVLIVRRVTGTLDVRVRRGLPPAVDAAWLPVVPLRMRSPATGDLPRRSGRAPPALLAS
jgi:hypothetical protein